MLIKTISELFDLPNKPENPIEWLRIYFRQLAPKRTNEIKNDQDILKNEILRQESMVCNNNNSAYIYIVYTYLSYWSVAVNYIKSGTTSFGRKT